MVASAVVGSIVGIWLVLYLIYSFIRKAALSGTLEALEIYNNAHTEKAPTMIEVGEEVLKAKKVIALKEAKEAKAEAKMAKKQKKAE